MKWKKQIASEKGWQCAKCGHLNTNRPDCHNCGVTFKQSETIREERWNRK